MQTKYVRFPDRSPYSVDEMRLLMMPYGATFFLARRRKRLARAARRVLPVPDSSFIVAEDGEDFPPISLS